MPQTERGDRRHTGRDRDHVSDQRLAQSRALAAEVGEEDVDRRSHARRQQRRLEPQSSRPTATVPTPAPSSSRSAVRRCTQARLRPRRSAAPSSGVTVPGPGRARSPIVSWSALRWVLMWRGAAPSSGPSCSCRADGGSAPGRRVCGPGGDDESGGVRLATTRRPRPDIGRGHAGRSLSADDRGADVICWWRGALASNRVRTVTFPILSTKPPDRGRSGRR